MSRRNAASWVRVRNNNNVNINMERNHRNNRERSRERERRNDNEDYWRNDEPANENDENAEYLNAIHNVGAETREECYRRMRLKINVDMFINLLPRIKKKIEDKTCTICLEEFGENEKIKLDCNHIFHAECLKNHLYERCNFPIDPESYEIRPLNCPVCKRDCTNIIKNLEDEKIKIQLKKYKIQEEEKEEIECCFMAKEEGKVDEDEEKIKKLENELRELKNKKEKKDTEKKLAIVEAKKKKLEEEKERLQTETENLKNIYLQALEKVNENEEKIKFLVEQKKILCLKLGKNN